MSTVAVSPRVDAIERALSERYERLPIELLVESPFNPRKTFSPERMKELAASIVEKGVVEPIVVRPWSKHSEQFEIVCGARRYRASQLVSQSHVPAIVRSYTDAQVIEIMAIENGHRDDVPPLEEAAGYKQLLLVDKTYTAAMIAEKIGRTEHYVWNRLRLLELVDEARALLVHGIIGVEHAEIISKLKPAEQKRVIGRQNGGLFTGDDALQFGDEKGLGSGAYDRVKPVSVREMKQWIARNIRFDVKHAAAAAPLDFGPVAQRVEEAETQPGRGKKVVSITFEHYCPYNAVDDAERTYGSTAWKKAEGKDGQATCEHAVLGVVVAGQHYGQSLKVCIARDKCKTHWREVVEAKEKAAKLRESGKGKQAAKVEKKQEDNSEAKYRREAAERSAREKAWKTIEAHVIADGVKQVATVTKLTPAHAKHLEQAYDLDVRDAKKFLGATWFKNPAAALLVSIVGGFGISTYNRKASGFDQFIADVAKPLGLDIKRLEAVRDKHQPKTAAAPAKKAS